MVILFKHCLLQISGHNKVELASSHQRGGTKCLKELFKSLNIHCILFHRGKGVAALAVPIRHCSESKGLRVFLFLSV